MLVLAYGLVQGGITALANPDAANVTSVSRVLPDSLQAVEVFWQLAYLVAGLAMFYGVLRPEPLVEVLGTWLAGWSLGVNVLALLLLRGASGTGPALGAFLISILACAWRIRALHRRAASDRRLLERPFHGPEKRRLT